MTAPRHTIVLSDLHLTEAEPERPGKPLWKRYKRADLFIDGEVEQMLESVRGRVDGPAELVLNGDVFDFDAVMSIPRPAPFPTSWLERRRGLSAEQDKSAWKMLVILRDHPVFVRALRQWILDGHQLVFVIGNHDLELHWPAVQRVLHEVLRLPPERQAAVRICEWFYLSGHDTLITHGNQYDRYCVCQDPVHPTIELGGKARMRLPFGDLAGKIMTNGMGLFNPHVEESFIKPLREYLVFFYKVVARNQPLLLLTWFWSAIATLVVTLREGLHPPLRDPLTVEPRVEEVAARARVEPRVVRTLRAVDVHSAVHSPWMVARELWLDRAALFLLVGAACIQVFGTVAIFADVSSWWLILFFTLFFVPFLFYARTVQSDTQTLERSIFERLSMLARIVEVRRIVMGHTHRARHHLVDEVEYLNSGTWSPAFHDVACTEPYGSRFVAWIRPVQPGGERSATLLRWEQGELVEEAMGPPQRAPQRPQAWGLQVRRRT